MYSIDDQKKLGMGMNLVSHGRGMVNTFPPESPSIKIPTKNPCY